MATGFFYDFHLNISGVRWGIGYPSHIITDILVMKNECEYNVIL